MLEHESNCLTLFILIITLPVLEQLPNDLCKQLVVTQDAVLLENKKRYLHETGLSREDSTSQPSMRF